MDTKSEDTMVRQIEKSLSNNINENLFLTGRVFENYKTPAKGSSIIIKDEDARYKDEDTRYKVEDSSNRVKEISNKVKDISNKVEDTKNKGEEPEDYPLVNYDYISTAPTLSRAEYIRQAREACLRQLSNSQVYSRPFDVNYMEPEPINQEQLNNKQAKAMKLFHTGSDAGDPAIDENTPQEIASFRNLIIRTVCAIVLFLTVFIIDKFELKIGNITHIMIQDYVTGNDSLQGLEDILVTWFK